MHLDDRFFFLYHQCASAIPPSWCNTHAAKSHGSASQDFASAVVGIRGTTLYTNGLTHLDGFGSPRGNHPAGSAQHLPTRFPPCPIASYCIPGLQQLHGKLSKGHPMEAATEGPAPRLACGQRSPRHTPRHTPLFHPKRRQTDGSLLMPCSPNLSC